MKALIRLLIALTAALAAVLSLSGTAAAGPLVVATDINFPPFEFKGEDGEYTGFDMELWDAVAGRIGVRYRIEATDFNGIIPGLQEGRFDVGIAGMTIKPERASVVDFSDGYYKAGLLILVRSEENSIGRIEDLKGKVVATKFATTSADFLTEKAGAREIKLFPNNDAMFLELLSGGSDAVVFDSPVVADFLRKTEGDKVKVVGPLYGGQAYGIAFAKGSPLLPGVNAALRELRADGTYAELYRKWFGTDPK